nr:LPO_1073/Vpar_1526 family protein [Mycobacterium kubicae]
MLADLAGEPIRTRREIVLREAIECAPKLTTNHLNALSAIFRVTRFRHLRAHGVVHLLSRLDKELRPHFGAIPLDSFDYGYMGATQAGTYVPAVGTSIYSRIVNAHRNAMYEPFDVAEFQHLCTGTIEQITADLTEIAQMIEIPYELSQQGSQKLKLKPEKVEKILSVDSKVIQGLSGAESKFREFLRKRSVNEKQFTTIVYDENPELAQFFDLLQRTGALNFQLSPVGIMLARHEMENRSPETAAQVDALFED